MPQSDKSAALVSEVNITLIKPCNGLIGFATLLWDGCVYLSSIGIHQKLDGSGYRLTYPTRKAGAQSIALFHPTTRAASAAIEQAVFARLKDVMKNVSNPNAGYAGPEL